ncbi:MAG: 23S rRNA (adenine(2503)-C(2))-methyltransferase RlmN [Thermoleophilia bacterium]|nr:23S rRNA (adenine(2503)-C(2))-methyltransferase RlmN [Thermoleophilia bacterium]
MDTALLTAALAKRKLPAFRERQILHAARREFAASWDEVTTLPKALRAELAEEVPFSTVTVEHEERSKDGSIKLRLATADGFPLEAVLMRFDQPHARGTDKKLSRYTACLSSQSGCALACTFCATGAMGLGRNLTEFEILDQFLELAQRRIGTGDGRIDNVVMMGMGEPFHNYDNVMAAIKNLNSPDGPGLAARRIAISTVGWVPGIERLADEPIQVKLALSLHAPNDQVRGSIMPVNRKFPLDRVLKACRTYRTKTGRRIFIEYLMLEGVNDQPEHAKELAHLLGPDNGFHVNLIAYNPTGTDYIGSSDEVVRHFAAILERKGVSASYRISRARDISGACGQLAAPIAAAKRKAREAKVARMAERDAEARETGHADRLENPTEGEKFEADLEAAAEMARV